MNTLSEPDTIIMTMMATTMAATMIGRSFASPTAVNTESSENTMSMTRDLQDGHDEVGIDTPPRADLARALQSAVDLQHALAEQEQAAGEQNQIAPGDALVPDVEQRLHEPREPHDREQQRNARQHGECQARDARRAPAAAPAAG